MHDDDGADDAGDAGDAGDDGGFDLLVPASFSVTLPKRDEPARLTAHNFEQLKHRAVVVIANGFTYRGVFCGADEDDVYLKGELRWWVLPLSSVTTVRLDPERDSDVDAG